jgi:hypothetical protein
MFARARNCNRCSSDNRASAKPQTAARLTPACIASVNLLKHPTSSEFCRQEALEEAQKEEAAQPGAAHKASAAPAEGHDKRAKEELKEAEAKAALLPVEPKAKQKEVQVDPVPTKDAPRIYSSEEIRIIAQLRNKERERDTVRSCEGCLCEKPMEEYRDAGVSGGQH